MPLIGPLIAYTVPLLVGLAAALLAERRRSLFSPGERVVVALAVGIGLQTMYIFWLGLVGIRFTFISCAAIAGPAAAVLGWKFRSGRRRARPDRPDGRAPRAVRGKRWLAGTIILLLSAKILANFYIASASPAYFDDSVTIWNYKARVFHHHRGLVKDPRHPDFFGGNAPKYPNAVPLFKAWIAIASGGWREAPVNSVSPVIYLLSGFLIYYGLRRFRTPWISLIGAYLLLSLPLFAFHGAFVHVDNYVGVYLLGGLIYLYRWMRERQTGLLLAAAGFFAVGGWIKDEGLILFGGGALLPLAIFLFRHPGSWKRGWLLPAVLLLFILPWLAAELVFRFPMAVVDAGYFRLEFHPKAFVLLKRFFLETGNYNIFWIVYPVSLLMLARVARKEKIIYPVMVNLGTLAAALGPFVFTPLFKWLGPGTTINRAMLMVIPSLIWTIVMIWGIWLEDNPR